MKSLPAKKKFGSANGTASGRNDWHTAFFEALQMELREYHDFYKVYAYACLYISLMKKVSYQHPNGCCSGKVFVSGCYAPFAYKKGFDRIFRAKQVSSKTSQAFAG
jgi:hypothetical protein